MQIKTILARRQRSTVEEKKLGWEVNHDGKMVWLQELALRVLKRFGQTAIVPITTVETIRVVVEYDSVIKAAQTQIAELRESDLEPMCIYLGSDYVEMWRTEFLGMFSGERVDFKPTVVDTVGVRHFNSTHNEMLGLPIVLVPNFQGLFVAPKVI